MPTQNDSGLDSRVRDLDARSREVEGRLRVVEIDNAGTKKWMEYVTEQIATFVTRTEFGPVKMIAYGGAGTALAAICTALLAKVIVK